MCIRDSHSQHHLIARGAFQIRLVRPGRPVEGVSMTHATFSHGNNGGSLGQNQSVTDAFIERRNR
eukprot:6553924-Prorocentrum_lima.AAC.1